MPSGEKWDENWTKTTYNSQSLSPASDPSLCCSTWNCCIFRKKKSWNKLTCRTTASISETLVEMSSYHTESVVNVCCVDILQDYEFTHFVKLLKMLPPHFCTLHWRRGHCSVVGNRHKFSHTVSNQVNQPRMKQGDPVIMAGIGEGVLNEGFNISSQS